MRRDWRDPAADGGCHKTRPRPQARGFVEGDQRGSHLTLWHPTTGSQTTVPVHGGDVKRGLMKLILKQAGLTEAEFRSLL